MPDVAFDRFYRYDELTAVLRAWAEERPDLVRLESVGRSYEGRDIWLVSVTRFETGADREKPALFVDANIHAAEVTGATAALRLLDRLVRGYGSDDRVTRALDTRVFYVVPRVNPDGAELALADRPRIVRSSVRPWPVDEPKDGLHAEDADGDGRILTMRVPDPNGPWKRHPDDPRVMVVRDADDVNEDGEFFRIFPEGTIRNYDGFQINVARPREGLDLNRNFPMEWTPEGEQLGAGPYPTSEPEVRALVQALVDRPNVTGYITYHTFSGVHLRPYSSYADEHFPSEDLRIYELIGKRATELTGYPSISVYHGFKYQPKESIKGTADDWVYDHLGVFGWTTEFWSPIRAAGIEEYHPIEWLRDHPPEDELRVVRWSDEHTGGEGYVDWYPFDHPQLGRVELGGWNLMRFWGNPPLSHLEREIESHAEFALFHLLISPRLELHTLETEPVGEGSWLVRLVLHNTGWLPTYVAKKALERKAVRPLEVELTLPEGARLLSGEVRTEAGQLTGRVEKRSTLWWGNDESTSDRVKLEWVVDAPHGGTLGIEARHQRAGVVRRVVVLR